MVFIEIIESKIVGTNFKSSILKDDLKSYYWTKKNIIVDVLMKENICAVKNNDEVTWYSLDESNADNISCKILSNII